MSDLVRARRYAVAAGALAALFVGAAYVARPVPDTLVSWLGGPDGGVDRIGGVRVRYRPAATAHGGDVMVIDLPGVDRDQMNGLEDLIVGGGVVLRETRETDFAERVGPSTGVELDFDAWREMESGAPHRVAFLRAVSREALDGAIAAARARGVTPRDRGEILFEYVEARDLTHPGYWRTHELAPDVAIDGSLIQSASGSFDPNTEWPVVLLDFTREGTGQFCEVTRRLVGKKLATVLGDRVRSVPIINTPICNGRASIAMGGTDPRRMEREAAALVAVLSQGALPRGGTVEDIRYRPPADVSTQEWLGRALLALIAGLVLGLVVYALLRSTKPEHRAEPLRGDGGFPWRRLAVTLLAPLALRLGEELTLPGVNDVEWQHVLFRAGDGSTRSISVIALGIMPILTSFVLVELVALAVPQLRWRRHDPAGRRALGKAVAIAAVALALVQGYFAARYLEGMSRGGLELVLLPGTRFVIVAMVSMAAGTILLAVVAGLIREHGLGNGYGALFASGMAIAAVRWVLANDEPAGRLMHGSAFGAREIVALLGAVAVVAITVCVMRWRVAGGERDPRLRVPTAGLAPLSELGGLAFVFGLVALFGFGVSFEALVWLGDLKQMTWLAAAIVIVAVPVWSWLLARPRLLERVALQAGLPRTSRATWLRATILTGVAFGSVVVLGIVVRRIGTLQSAWLGEPVAIMIATAVVLDIVDDARARRAALAPAAVLHQIQYAGVVERVLTDAGIPCHIHASHLRTLIAFFAPWAPAIVLVPESLADDARAKLDAVLRASTAHVPAAQVRA